MPHERSDAAVRGQSDLHVRALHVRAVREETREADFICSTDAPFLNAPFIRRLRALCEDHDIAIVRDEGHHHPLCAIYKPWLAREAEALLAENRARPFFLLERAKTRIVTREDLLADPALRKADPHLWCLRNLNTPEDYQAALRDLALAE